MALEKKLYPCKHKRILFEEICLDRKSLGHSCGDPAPSSLESPEWGEWSQGSKQRQADSTRWGNKHASGTDEEETACFPDSVTAIWIYCFIISPLHFLFLAKIEEYGFLGESHPLTLEMRGAAHTDLLAHSALPGLQAACVEHLGPMLPCSTPQFPLTNSEMCSPSKHIPRYSYLPISSQAWLM